VADSQTDPSAVFQAAAALIGEGRYRVLQGLGIGGHVSIMR